MSEWKNFSDEELQCKCCGTDNTSLEFRELMDIVQELREELGFPFRVTSAYRCEDHPIEAKKDKHGQHTIAAIDINVWGDQAVQLIEAALAKGITGLGVNQKGPYHQRFIHLDVRDGPRVIWSY